VVAKREVGMAGGGSSGAAVAAFGSLREQCWSLGWKGQQQSTLCVGGYVMQLNGVCERHGEVVFRGGGGWRGVLPAWVKRGWGRSYNFVEGKVVLKLFHLVKNT